MKEKTERSLLNRFLNATCFLSILVACIYVAFTGFNIYAGCIIIGAVLATSIPVIVGGEGIIDILSGIIEAIVDGALAILEAIASIFN